METSSTAKSSMVTMNRRRILCFFRVLVIIKYLGDFLHADLAFLAALVSLCFLIPQIYVLYVDISRLAYVNLKAVERANHRSEL